ncbi:hypothetical protein [Sphingosinicella microcystinivorans]|uniref:hypothetical protein n=1 Tax=Sphingosinicella microcystinivorans TaxID=335406 RepID=UPI0022F3BF6B|nr:hypothetical protein [Sphingosinicella microcystinivorans]WBX85770.1 hypothetical protein PE061_07640 [Sphingosinicella microcystinivorans]
MDAAAVAAMDLAHENLSYHMDALAIGFEETDIGALERRARATLAATLFLRELHNPDFADDGAADWAHHITQIADALEVRPILAGMLAAGSDND